ncbi:MAG: hypothetical protein DMF76_12415 [Acidobacteria bacterium]|nr:MAG: hypothetical protein DMF76_12415 [Acidobacteriota bacterium]
MVEQAGKPGVSVAGLALKHGVNANQLRRWMRLQHLRRALPLPTLLPVTLAQPPAVGVATEVHASPIIETALAGTVVHVPEAAHQMALAHAKRANEGRELSRLGSASAFRDIAVFDDGTGFEIPARGTTRGCHLFSNSRLAMRRF